MLNLQVYRIVEKDSKVKFTNFDMENASLFGNSPGTSPAKQIDKKIPSSVPITIRIKRFTPLMKEDIFSQNFNTKIIKSNHPFI